MAVVSDDRLYAVLIEPQLARFREVCGLEQEPLTADFTGFHRHAILSRDRVFLFPRHRTHVRRLLAEQAVLEALAELDVPAPRVDGVWRDGTISPYPFMSLSRLPGATWSKHEASATLDDVRTMLHSLGRSIARWHCLDRVRLPMSLRRRRTRVAIKFEARLQMDTIRDTTQFVATALNRPATHAAHWCQTLEPLTTMRRVFTHGDVHESQLMVSDCEVTGVLDWEHAGIGHPLMDFNFGEWGVGIFAWEDDFGLLRRTLWESYAEARGGQLPPWSAVHLFFCIYELAHLMRVASGNNWDRRRLASNQRLLDELDYAR